jgi:hypothetical protein
VPWQEYIGHDFHCVLIDPESTGRNVLAVPSFAVQVKSQKQELRDEKDAEVAWISSKENPLFICFADPKTNTNPGRSQPTDPQILTARYSRCVWGRYDLDGE